VAEADDITSATGSTTEAIVLVERSVAEGEFVQTNVSAKFMRLASGADPDLAERVVGGSWLDLPAPGECEALTPFAAAEDSEALTGLGTIELLDVGDLSIQAGTNRMPLATRAFPDVGAFVSGVFYTSRDAQSDLPAPARYVLESTGTATQSPFSIEADAPSAPDRVRLFDTALTEGVVFEEGTASTLRWTASEAPAVGDLVYVDLTAPSGTGVRCAYNDSGEGVIPSSVLDKKTWGALPAAVALSVHRIRQGGFAAAGIDAGELRFDLSVVGHATIVSTSP